MLITNANLQKLTDKLAIAWERCSDFINYPAIGSDDFDEDTVPVSGTYFELIKSAEDLIANYSDNHDQEVELGPSIRGLLNRSWARYTFTEMEQVCKAINDHCNSQGSKVDDSIIDLNTYLDFYNQTPFSCLLHPSFARIYNYLATPSVLNKVGVFSPGIHPTLNSVYTNGMGTKTYSGTFTAGDVVNTDYHQPVLPIVEVLTDFSGGASPPVVTIAGTDDQGGTSTTWTVTLTGNNPTSAFSATCGSASAHTQSSRLVSSSAGMIPGMVLQLNSGLVDYEPIIIESVEDGTHATFACRKAHSGTPTLTGKKSYATTPSIAGRRLVSVSGITLTLSGHTGGSVRVVGRQERMGNPQN